MHSQKFLKPLKSLHSYAETLAIGLGFTEVVVFMVNDKSNIFLVDSNDLFMEMIKEEFTSNGYDIESIEKFIIPIVKSAFDRAQVQNKKENNTVYNQILMGSKLATLGEVTASVVHDINGPLSTIKVTCEDFLDEAKAGAHVESRLVELYLGQVLKASTRIQKMIDYLRSYSRNSNNEKLEHKAIVDLIEDSIFMLKQKIRQNGVVINKFIEEDLKTAELHCFANRFEQVIMNLMGNACDAMKNSNVKEITLQAKIEDGFLLLSIADTGTGISPEVIHKIFDGFFTTKPKGEGTGLGLSIVKNIVSEHHGDILVTSEVGKGSVFTVKIPESSVVMHNSDDESSVKAA